MSTEAKKTETYAEVQNLLAEIFEVERSAISSETQFGDLPKWDSMGHMDLMMALETKFGIEINADSIRDLVSIAAILDSIESVKNG